MNQQQKFDVIVIGLGAMGAATCWQLARRGVKVLGLEQFAVGHDRGSSHGATRLIRQAYFEHADYVPLLLRAYQGWDELMRESGRPDLFVRNGVVLFGQPTSEIMRGCLASAKDHALKVERLNPTQARKAFSWITLPEDFEAVLEPNAGYLRVEECNRVHAQSAARLGATINAEARVLGWEEDEAGIVVTCTSGTYCADRLIICSGAWTKQMLPKLAAHLAVHRVSLHWFRSKQMVGAAGMPCFGVDTGERFLYGVPAVDQDGVKIGDHTPGVLVTDPSEVDRDISDADRAPIYHFCERFLPHLERPSHKGAACIYTMTQDQHFILDHYPGSERVVFGAGFSGHGFKFAPVIGEVLADLSLDGGTNQPIDFLRLKRFA